MQRTWTRYFGNWQGDNYLNMNILLKNILFTLFIPGTVGGYFPHRLGTKTSGQEAWWNWLGLFPLMVGACILLMCIWDFGKKGEGTPFPLDPPKNLVTGKLYQYSRNPMYVAVLAAIAGWGLWFSSIWVGAYFLLIALIFNLFVRWVEEPALKKQFGETYESYRKRVPRWL